MYKSIVVLFALGAVSYGMPHWQLLPPVPGYIPVYIQHGDQPLEEINLELAEAFHAIPSGRSASNNVLASDEKEQNNVAEEMQDDSPHPPDVQESKKEESLSEPAVSSVETNKSKESFKESPESAEFQERKADKTSAEKAKKYSLN